MNTVSAPGNAAGGTMITPARTSKTLRSTRRGRASAIRRKMAPADSPAFADAGIFYENAAAFWV
jgi:hypothetical protein